MPGPFLADTNVYVTAANDAAFAAEFAEFRRTTEPLLVSVVVLAELSLGLPRHASQERMVAALTAAGPALTPTGDDWMRAAAAIAGLGGDAVTKSRSFWNDALLAAQCARLGCTLITRNTADFRRIGRFIRADVASPFPGG